jgi:peptide-methionine (S)-S-oxide reductase
MLGICEAPTVAPLAAEAIMFKKLTGCRSLALGAVMMCCGAAFSQETAMMIPPPAQDAPRATSGTEKAVLAGGCYWGTQGIFEHVNGVKRVVAGWSGGSSDSDGGAESVMITFDPNVVSYGQLLQIFFSVVHDPTQLNRQGPDVGVAYRSDVFYMNDAQRQTAEAYIAQLGDAKVFAAKIVTRLDAFSKFHAADDNQQDFMTKNPRLQYIVVNDRPKLASLKRLFPSTYRESAVEFR